MRVQVNQLKGKRIMHYPDEPGITQRERARRIVMLAKGGRDSGIIRGMIGARVVSLPMSVERLAKYGVPENLDLPYDSDKLRALVQELAQIEVD
jgi:hypothetical protein